MRKIMMMMVPRKTKYVSKTNHHGMLLCLTINRACNTTIQTEIIAHILSSLRLQGIRVDLFSLIPLFTHTTTRRFIHNNLPVIITKLILNLRLLHSLLVKIGSIKGSYVSI